MDKETREFLENMMNQINSRLEGLESGQKEITLKLDGVIDEVARLREDVTILKNDVKEAKVDLKLVKIVTVEQANEIEKLKIIK
jgi:hypothetical protein